ncbi:MAG TPA: hypothetical protein VGJ00_02275 [Rhabdochlamydiaceae bacterium]|jgi:hypothetical protein
MKLLIGSICLAHVLFLGLMLFFSPFTPKIKQHKRIAVHTVMPSPLLENKPQPAAVKTAAPKNIAPAQTKAAAKVTEVPKKSVPTLKKEAPKAAQKSQPVKQQHVSSALLRQLEESIAKIEDKSDKNRLSKSARAHSSTYVPAPLQMDALRVNEALSEEDYVHSLTNQMHASLHLPDFGEVKIELTLRQDGTIAKLRVLKAESDKNRQYLESHLPQLKFSCLKGAYAKQKEYTFVLNFCNEL